MKKQFLLLLVALSLTTIAQAKTTEVLTGELALNHTLAADIPPSSIQTRIGKEGLDDLYNRFEQHYGEFVRKDNPRKVDFDFIMGLKNSQVSFELDYLFNVGLDEGLPIEKFTRFGITEQNNGRFTYDFGQSPYLASPKSLFTMLTNDKRVSSFSPLLLAKGFRLNDIKIIRDHIKNKSLKNMLHEQEVFYLRNNLTLLKQAIALKMILSPEKYEHKLASLSYISNFLRQVVYRNWALLLMSKLDSQRQRILKALLIERLNGDVSFSRSSRNKSAERFARSINNIDMERYNKEVNEMINKGSLK